MSDNRSNIGIEESCLGFLKSNIPDLEAVYLFGSRVKGTARKDSDVDIAFKSNDPISNLKRWELQQELAIILNSDVDLVDLNKATEVMQFQVVREGKRIFENDYQEAEKYEDKVYFLYLDLCELRQPIINNIQESGSFYG